MSQADERAQMAAEAMLERNFVKSPPVNVVELSKSEGLSVAMAYFSDQARQVAGYIDLEQQSVVVNAVDRPNRQRFTIAHELGHWALHQDQLQNNPERGVLMRVPLGTSNRDPVEREANVFAANLLVPQAFLRTLLPSFGRKGQYHPDDIPDLARTFVVSEDVIGFRLQICGLL
ncbi:MAG TPA: ImmA/IrrE family metallo-endopeptidase [Armatimonadota bacterium]|jgi:Zn-dependent peptidase ImmA (M78 family)